MSPRLRSILVLLVAGQMFVTPASFAWPRGLHEDWWVAPAALALCLLAFISRQESAAR